MRPAILALGIFLVAGLAQAGGIYSWKDASGKIHYSDAPPPGVQAKKVGSTNAPAPSLDARRSLADQEADFRKRRDEAAKARAEAEQEQARADGLAADCRQAREYLAALRSGQRIARVSESGERVVLDDNGRAEAIERTQKQMQEHCPS